MATKREREAINEDIKCGDCINVYDEHNLSVDKTHYVCGKCKKRTTIVFLSVIEKQCPYAVSRLGLKNKK